MAADKRPDQQTPQPLNQTHPTKVQPGQSDNPGQSINAQPMPAQAQPPYPPQNYPPPQSYQTQASNAQQPYQQPPQAQPYQAQPNQQPYQQPYPQQPYQQPYPQQPNQPHPYPSQYQQPNQQPYPPQQYQQPYQQPPYPPQPQYQPQPNQQPYQQPYPPQYQQPYPPQYQQQPYDPNQAGHPQIYDPNYQPPYDANYQQQQPYDPNYQPQKEGFDINSLKLNLEPNIAAPLTYIFFIVSGIFFLMTEKENQLVRFHAIQSIIFSLSWVVVYFAFSILWIIFSGMSAIIGFYWPLKLVGIFSNFVFLGLFVVWIVTMIKAYYGEKFKLPIIGEMAEKQLAKNNSF